MTYTELSNAAPDNCWYDRESTGLHVYVKETVIRKKCWIIPHTRRVEITAYEVDIKSGWLSKMIENEVGRTEVRPHI
jgi:hypothetical protein